MSEDQINTSFGKRRPSLEVFPHLCSEPPAAFIFPSSRLKGNGQPGLFSCGMSGSSQPHPPPPKPPSTAVKTGLHPLLLCPIFGVSPPPPPRRSSMETDESKNDTVTPICCSRHTFH
ncbi:hypothetical protein FQA47_005152 [Oryzias melastigma]|uniref:Uncharacterized protein n=1 Tax=Oryzias melastigma TaxID=30732 RepID=A0A834CEQ4_ORYME|nr:hypothetical protein FQA47_005152 [Oryzias melastigma]